VTSTSIEASSLPASRAGTGTRVNPLVLWALYATAFSIPLEVPDRFAFEVTTMMGSLFLLATVLQPGACYGRVPWALGAYVVFLWMQLAAVVTQGQAYPGGLFLDQVTRSSLMLLLWILVFWACSNLFREERIYRAALQSLILGCLVRATLPLLGLARTASVQGSGDERITAFGQNANQSAQVLAQGLIALIGLAYVRPRGGLRPRFLGWGAVGLIAISLIETGSRGGLATFCLGLLVYLVTGRTLRVRIRNATVALAGLGLVGFLLTHSDLMRGRLAKAETGSFSQREKIFPLLLGMIREKPVTGWGPITNKYELASRLGDPTHDRRDAHNLVLEVLTASGVLGAIPFFLGVWLCLRSAWTTRAGPRGSIPLAMLLALLAGSMSENRIAGPLLWMVLACALASGSDAAARASRSSLPGKAPDPASQTAWPASSAV
jgi:O-antigen ligase